MTIESVLTPAEWERTKSLDARGLVAAAGSTLSNPIGFFPIDVPRSIAILNAALPDADPRKITREKIRAIYRLHDFSDDVRLADEDRATLHFLKGLESYLPPAP